MERARKSEDVVLSSSPISIRGGSPVRRRSSLSRSESDFSRSLHSPTLTRSIDPNDPQVRERQRTMDVDMAMQLSLARRETIPPLAEQSDSVFPTLSTHEQHEIDIARGEPEEERTENVDPTPAFLEMNHISAHDPTLLAHESHLHAVPPSSTFRGGLPTYQPNASHSEFDFTPMDEFATAEKTLLNLASPKFSLSALRARTVAPDTDDVAEGPSDPEQRRSSPRRKLSHSSPRPRHHRKGGGGKMAMFEGNTGDLPPSFTIDAGAQTTTGIPGILHTGHDRPYRFSFYSNALSATIHARSLSELPADGQSFMDLFSGVLRHASRVRRGTGQRDRGPHRLRGTICTAHPRHSASDSESSTWWLDVQSVRHPPAHDGGHPDGGDAREDRALPQLLLVFPLVRPGPVQPDAPRAAQHLPLSAHAAPQNVRRRIKQLKDYISVTSDWISYALIDDITDAFGPLIQGIEYEVDSIDELVLILKEAEQSDMLRRIGTCRKKVMGLLRLMGNKADVVKGLAKRCNEHWRVAPTSDIISIEMTDANNQINDVLSKLTALGTADWLCKGLWGMNVHVPGQDIPGYACLVAFAIIGGYSTYKFMVHRR
ncbi:hypothetical protein B0H13DRAFT_2082008 [Mycena leptocephala]|nr:hypothetical protein B0H13DRAFT_2082008 [Mycena leptocephala]